MTSSQWDRDRAREFCRAWLPAWTGNRPERLLSYYSDDAFYSDPAVREGIVGREHLLNYFRKLLAAYPEWIWIHRRSLPVPDGFLNYWEARLNGAPDAPSWEGVCVVQIRGDLIYRNEVYLDRAAMPAPLKRGR